MLLPPTMVPMRRTPFLFLFLSLVVHLTGCEEAVAPTLEGEAQFTLYGVLDPLEATQVVRVFPIRAQLEVPAPGPLGITFTTTDLDTGERQVWRDSVVTLANGTAGNVFAASFRPGYDHTFELVVERAGGEPASVVVDVPPLIDPILRAPTFGAEGVKQEVFWPGAPRINQARVVLELQAANCQTYEYEYEADLARPLEFGWTLVVPFGALSGAVQEAIGQSPNSLSIMGVMATAQVASRDWNPPGGNYDPEALIEPGTFSNVFNGFGFVGASYPSSLRWRPTSEVAQRAGFRPAAFGSCGP